VDDLMFSSKIKASAKPLSMTVSFARSRDAALTAMRANLPSLVLFDLDGQRMDPLGILAAMKADEHLKNIPTLGFVSHVHADMIQAARAAAIGEVLARSAFTVRLPEILAQAR
jgi:CheY-like chemotaxis protein